MRLKRLMSIVLAVALVMSFAMSASAGTLYYAQDFSQYNGDIMAMQNDVYIDTSLNGAGTQTYANIDTYRAEGKSMVGHSVNIFYLADDATDFALTVNGDGNYQLEQLTNARTSALNFGYIAPTSWDAVANTDETYVISMDINPVSIGYAANFMNVVGKVGSAYNGPILLTRYPANAMNLCTAANGWGGTTFIPAAAAGGETIRFAAGFKYNATTGKMERVAASDCVAIAGATHDGIAALTTIEGIVYNSQSNRELIGNVKMYTIDTAEGFKVSSPVDGDSRVSTDYGTITLTFNHPVAEVTADDLVVTVTKDGEAYDMATVGDIETSVVNGEYVSTLDVDMPLEENSAYEITVSGVKNELGSELVDGTVSFSTPKPDLTFAVSTSGMTVGSMGEATATIYNNTLSETKAVSVIYGVYTSAGKLVDVVYANETVAADSKATISAGIKLGADAAKAKVMIWDGLNAISPLNGFYGVDVAAQ